MNVRRKGDKASYRVQDVGCLGRDCFAPGHYQHRSASSSGSRNTGSPDTPCCLTNAYRGCPTGPVGETQAPCEQEHCDGEVCKWCGGSGTVRTAGLPVIDEALTRKRRAEGWHR